MTWFKVDDKLYTHRKVRSLSKGALALWVLAGSYCADHLTDGVVQPSDVGWLGGTDDEVAELVEAGMWDEHPDGWEFHDWEHYQPSRSKVESRRAAERERVAAWREQQRASKKNDSSYIPVPSRPSFAVTNAVSNGMSNAVTDAVQPADPQTVASVVADIRSTLRSAQ